MRLFVFLLLISAASAYLTPQALASNPAKPTPTASYSPWNSGPQPPMGPPMGPPMNQPMGPPMGNPMDHQMPPYAGGGMMITNDRFKDQQLFNLLYDSRGVPRDIPDLPPNYGPYRYGWSLPDYLKDHVVHFYGYKIQQRGGIPTPRERQILELIGDPLEMLPGVFGPGMGRSPQYGMGGSPGGYGGAPGGYGGRPW